MKTKKSEEQSDSLKEGKNQNDYRNPVNKEGNAIRNENYNDVHTPGNTMVQDKNGYIEGAENAEAQAAAFRKANHLDETND